MGYELRRWLAEHMPAAASSGERLVALEIADQANDTTRRAWPDLDLVARRTGFANAKQVGKVLGKLAAHGLELRVAVGKAADGTPVFAYEGHKTNYRIPTATELGVQEVPQAGDHSTQEVPRAGLSGPPPGTQRSPARGREVPQAGDPSPQAPSDISSKKKQLRPRAPQRAGAQQLPPHIAIIVDATGATPDEAQTVAQLINDEKTPTNLNGFLRRLAADGELADWLQRVRADNDRDRRAEFMNHIRAQPRCEHGQPGGHIPSPGGWVACPQERRRLTNTTPDRKPANTARAAFEEMTRLTAAGREDDAALVLAELPDDILDEVDQLEAAAKVNRYARPKPKRPDRPADTDRS